MCTHISRTVTYTTHCCFFHLLRCLNLCQYVLIASHEHAGQRPNGHKFRSWCDFPLIVPTDIRIGGEKFTWFKYPNWIRRAMIKPTRFGKVRRNLRLSEWKWMLKSNMFFLSTASVTVVKKSVEKWVFFHVERCSSETGPCSPLLLSQIFLCAIHTRTPFPYHFHIFAQSLFHLLHLIESRPVQTVNIFTA